MKKAALVGDPKIRREFPGDLVPKSKASVYVGDAGADAASGIGLAVYAELELGLQYETLGDEQIVGCLQTSSEPPAVAGIGGGLLYRRSRAIDLEPQGLPTCD